MAYKGGKLSDGTPLNVAVYRAYRNAGLSHNQALAITAEVGRENSFSAGILFGNHTDPAANSGGKPIRNMGMLSWNQGRDVGLERYLNQQGVMRGGQMAKTQANLNAQAQFSVREMKSKRYAPKLKNFWGNPNASPESYAKELGKNYIVWAYGQNTIKARGGGRQPFNWKAHDGYRRGYLNTLNSMLGGKERYTSQQNESYQAQQPKFQRPPLLSMADIQAQAPYERPPLIDLADVSPTESAFMRAPMVDLADVDNTQVSFERPPLVDLSDVLVDSSDSLQVEPPIGSDNLSTPYERTPMLSLDDVMGMDNNIEPKEWQVNG